MLQTPYELTPDQYVWREGAAQGVCLHCGRWRDDAEPGAVRLACPECGEPAVFGIEQALLRGTICIRRAAAAARSA